MPITFVDGYHNDSSHGLGVNLTKAALYCCQWTVKNTPTSWHFFLLFWIMTNTLKNHH